MSSHEKLYTQFPMIASRPFTFSCFRFALFAIAVVCLLPGAARAQKIDQGKLDAAARRFDKAVYGLKAREVLWGKTPTVTPVSPVISQFQNALTSLSKP